MRSKTEWAVLDELRRHDYDYRNKGEKPDDPGWHACRCGWEGYWCDYQPHVAERITIALDALRSQPTSTPGSPRNDTQPGSPA